MTVTTNTNKVQALGNGVTTSFPFTFRIYAASDLIVTRTVIATGVDTTLVLNTDYTVTGAASYNGGAVIMASAPATGTRVTIRRVLSITQPTDIRNQGSYFPETHEDALDRSAMINQQQQETLDRAIVFPASDDTSAYGEFPPAATRASNLLGFDENGKPVAVAPAAQSASALQALLAASSGASLVGVADSVPDSETRTVFSIISEKKRVTSLRRSSDPDWTLAFQRAAASGAKHIVVADGEYDVAAAIVADIAAGQWWEFNAATINMPTTGNVFLRAQNVSDWGIDGQVLVVGGGKAAATGAALWVLGANRFRVNGFGAKNIAGWGIKHDPGVDDGLSRGDQGQFIAPQLHGCYRGFENTADTGAEYSTMLAPMISGCTVGAIVAAGNTTIIGGDIVDNTDGLHVWNGSNHAHGIISAVNINHNTQYAIHANQVTNGQSFADCHIYGNGGAAGAIFLERCKGVTFDGGILDAWVYNYSGTGSGYNYIRNMQCPASYGAVECYDADALTPAELIVMGCYGTGAYKSGISINDPAPVYVHATRAAAATQAISGTTTLIFPTVSDNGDRRRAYDETTGVFTVPAGQAGQYKISANLFFTVAAIVAGNNFVEVFINDAAPRFFLPGSYGTTLLTFSVDLEMHLAAGDTVKIKATIDGSSPTFGGSTYMSGMSIKRIS